MHGEHHCPSERDSKSKAQQKVDHCFSPLAIDCSNENPALGRAG
jgi:hypothetical protein